MEAERQARLVSQSLTALAILAAVGGVVAGILAPGATPVYLLASATLLLLGGAYAQGTVPTHYDFENETDGRRFRRELVDHVLSALLLVVVGILGLIQVLALLTGLGFFTFLGALVVAFVVYYNAFLGLMLLILAGAVLSRNLLPTARLLTSGDRNVGRATLAATVVIVVLSLALASGLPQSLGITSIKPERAAFLLTFGLFSLFLFVRAWNRYPRFRDIGTWVESQERFKSGGFPRVAVLSLSAVTVVLLVAAAALQLGTGAAFPALALAGLANVVLLATPFGVGLTHVVEALERGLSDYDARRRRRRTILITLTSLLTALAALGLLLAAAAVAVPVMATVLTAFFPVVLLVLGVAGAAASVVRTQVQAEAEYDETRKAVGAYLAAGVTVLTFFGLFLASEIARGSFIGLPNGILLVTVATALAVLYVKNRLLLPSLIAMAQETWTNRQDVPEEEADVQQKIQRSMMSAYLLAMGVMLVGVVGIALMFVGVVPTPSSSSARLGVGAVWSVVLLLAIGLVLYRHLQRANLETPAADEKEQIYKRRLTQEQVNRYLVLGFSISTASTLFVMGVLVQLQVVSNIAGLALPPKFSTDFFVFAILLGLGPYGFYHSRQLNRTRAIDEKFPEFLRDLAESKRAGMTLTEAVITSSKGTYGELTYEIRKMAAQLEWGVAFTDALERFAERVQTPLIERSVTLIVQASNAGGNVIDVLTAAADDSREVQQILRERRDAMSIYVAIIYISFLVFIGVIAILNAQFIPQISKAVTAAASAGAPSIGGIKFAPVDEQAFRTLFFHAAIIQGLGGGLVAGVMSGGKPVEGLKHSFVMVIVAYVIFRFLIGG